MACTLCQLARYKLVVEMLCSSCVVQLCPPVNLTGPRGRQPESTPSLFVSAAANKRLDKEANKPRRVIKTSSHRCAVAQMNAKPRASKGASLLHFMHSAGMAALGVGFVRSALSFWGHKRLVHLQSNQC